MCPCLDQLESSANSTAPSSPQAWALSLLVWTPVQCVNLFYVPAAYQPAVVSAVNVGWKSTLSLLNHYHDREAIGDGIAHENEVRLAVLQAENEGLRASIAVLWAENERLQREHNELRRTQSTSWQRLLERVTGCQVDVRLKGGGSDTTCRPGVWGRAPAGARGSAPTGCEAAPREENNI